ncbi:MAG: 3-hydroxyisobutyrate dehydrogenase [Legionellales bacterium]|nr:3-hydroxyisobutyrate dehydrogenase [Legionellales bacterium]
MANIGFVGLGHMGLPMAINLVKAGHTVTGFDLQAQALESLKAAGGLVAKTLVEAALGKDVVITMLQTGLQVREVCLGAHGLMASAGDNALLIDCSTIDVQSSRLIHQQAALMNLVSVDAPVSGGVIGAAEGKLTFMVGGAQFAYDKAHPILSLMGQKIIHTGIAGSGQAAKICNNMILGISMIAISEAFTLAKQLGLEPDKLFEVVNHSSGQCWAMSRYVPVPGLLDNVPANRNYAPGFTTAMMLKDLRLSQTSAESVGLETLMGKQATAMYQAFYEDGKGELDFSAIIKAIAID